MFSVFLGPFMPYIAGGILVVVVGAYLYIKRLRSANKALEKTLESASEANKQSVKTVTQLAEDNAKYQKQFEEAVKKDIAAEQTKTEAINEAKTIVGSEEGKITQADLDRLAEAKKKRGK